MKHQVQDSRDDLDSYAPGDVDPESAEASGETSNILQETDRCTEAGSNRLRLERDLDLRSFDGVGVFGRERLKGYGFCGGLDHEESWDNAAEGVFDLRRVREEIFQRYRRTYHKLGCEKEQDCCSQDQSTPCWKLINNFVVATLLGKGLEASSGEL